MRLDPVVGRYSAGVADEAVAASGQHMLPAPSRDQRQLRTPGPQVHQGRSPDAQSRFATRYAVSLLWSRPSSFTSYPRSLDAAAAVKE